MAAAGCVLLTGTFLVDIMNLNIIRKTNSTNHRIITNHTLFNRLSSDMLLHGCMLRFLKIGIVCLSADLSFVHRRGRREELSLQKGLETGHWMRHFLRLGKPVLCQRQELVASVGLFQLHDVLVAQVAKAYQISFEIDHRT